MTFSKNDLPFLKFGLLTFVVCIAASVSLVIYSDHYLEQAKKDRASAQQRLIDARTQLAAAQGDQENMATYSREFISLQEQKVIGNEQRLDWIEGMEKLRQQGIVLDFKYTIAPQQGYTPSPAVDAGNFQINRSSMNMQLDLLHEEQLIQFVAALHTQLKGWYMLDGCTLSRAIEGTEASPLKADCSGGWLTFKNRNAP